MPTAADTIPKPVRIILQEFEGTPLDLAHVSRFSSEELGHNLDAWHRLRAVVDGAIVQLQGEVNRRESFRADGSPSSRDWQVARFGLSRASARAYDEIADKAMDLPHLTQALSTGEIGLDKMRLAAAVATPETDRELAETARSSTVDELKQHVRSRRRPTAAGDEADYRARSLRFNDPCRTLSVQLPAEDYATAKACIQAQARTLPTDGETGWDQRCCDAFMQLIGSDDGSRGRSHQQHRRGTSGPDTSLGVGPRRPYTVVLHAPLAAMIDANGDATETAGDLERGGLISLETVRRIQCDAACVVALDDDVGHTMYEGRQRRDPTGAQRREIWRRDRCCRFPGCANAIFTQPHHVRWWSKGGRTDLSNLALLCDFHHHLVHSSAGWDVRGDANLELTFLGPNGRAMTSRPSPSWTR